MLDSFSNLSLISVKLDMVSLSIYLIILGGHSVFFLPRATRFFVGKIEGREIIIHVTNLFE